MRRNVSTATVWAAIETAGAQGSALLFFAVFARLLTPYKFGAYAALLHGTVQWRPGRRGLL